MVAEPMAAAIGVGLPVETPTGNMVIDIGGGTTEIAVIALSGIVSDTSIRTGGDELDQAIVQFMRKNYNLLVGEPTAEAIKIKIGSAAPTGDEREMEVKGRDLVSGIPKTVRVHSDRDPRGGAGADPADRGRGAPRARDHAARARERHRRPRHRHDRRRRAHPRARHPARAGDRASRSTWTRTRSPAWSAAPAAFSTTTRNTAASSPPEHGQRVGTLVHAPGHRAVRRLPRPLARRRCSRRPSGARASRPGSARPCSRRWSGCRTGPRKAGPAACASAPSPPSVTPPSYLAQGLPSLLAENERLRQLLALSRRLATPLRRRRGAAPVPGHRRPHPAAQRRRARTACRRSTRSWRPRGCIGVVLNVAEQHPAS